MVTPKHVQLASLVACFAAMVNAGLMSRAVSLPAAVNMLNMAGDEQTISLQIGLKMQNIEKLEGMLRDVSDPKSPNYGKYLTAAQIADTFKPSQESSQAVTAWLESQGVTDIAADGAHINFATTVGKANSLLTAGFAFFDVGGISKLRTMEYSIPDDLHQHIALVTPTTFFGKMRAQSPIMTKLVTPRQSVNSTNCARLTTPPCLESMYNYASYKADPASGSKVAFGSFLNQSARQEDLSKYMANYKLPDMKFKSVLINGGLDHQDPRGDIGEANLDAQFMSAAVKTLPLTQFITGGSPLVSPSPETRASRGRDYARVNLLTSVSRPFVPNLRLPDEASNTNEPYLEYYQHLLKIADNEIPQVISNSYGDDEQVRLV
jgi:tripeptidyl-peptidase I